MTGGSWYWLDPTFKLFLCSLSPFPVLSYPFFFLLLFFPQPPFHGLSDHLSMCGTFTKDQSCDRQCVFSHWGYGRTNMTEFSFSEACILFESLSLREWLHDVTMKNVYTIQSLKSHKMCRAILRFLVFLWPDLGALQIDHLFFMEDWEVQSGQGSGESWTWVAWTLSLFLHLWKVVFETSLTSGLGKDSSRCLTKRPAVANT